MLVIALVQAGGWTTWPPRSLPSYHFCDSAGLPKSPWRPSLVEVFRSHPLYFGSQFSSANSCQEVVDLHLSPSNQVLGAFVWSWWDMLLGLEWQKGRDKEFSNTFVEIMGLASKNKSNSSSQLKWGVVQKVGLMSSDPGNQACLCLLLPRIAW